MNMLILPALTIIIPAIGCLLTLFLSQLEEDKAAEGKTRDWMLVLLVFLPTMIISFLLIPHMHDKLSYSIRWLPNIYFGLQLTELSTLFACLISSLGLAIALYSITFMEFDPQKTNYWFFLLLTMAGIMLGIFSNNLLWLFGGFEIAFFAGYFLIAHWHRKSGEEGEKAGKAALRFIILSSFGDFFLLLGFGLLYYVFGTQMLNELYKTWKLEPTNLLFGSSKTSRILITLFITIGSLIKSAQIPLICWVIGGEKQDIDMAKAPLPITAYLLTATIANTGLYLLGTFYPLLSMRGEELTLTITGELVGTGIELFDPTPFLLSGWSAIATIFITLGIIISSRNINRIITGASLIQLSFAFLGYSAANDLGYLSANFQLLAGSVISLALFVMFGIIIESLKMNSLDRIHGLETNFPVIQFMTGTVILSSVGLFPFTGFFSKDMIFEALRTSDLPSHLALMIAGILGSFLLIFGLVRVFFKTFYGKRMSDRYSIRAVKIQSMSIAGALLDGTILLGILIILIGFPKITFAKGLFNSDFILNYSCPLLGNYLSSLLILGGTIGMISISFLGYLKGKNLLEKIRNSRIVQISYQIFENGLYLGKGYELIFVSPTKSTGRASLWIKEKTTFLGIFWVLLFLSLLILIMILVGGM
ncbi:MAG: hypothetical protein GF308_12980 [Candidatus Heimdallarchaeota archaeon]|nr:hypothetical protein [Candidatus Heimdallarchaeota archaeon]